VIINILRICPKNDHYINIIAATWASILRLQYFY